MGGESLRFPHAKRILHMFRVFLKSKLLEGSSTANSKAAKAASKAAESKERSRNRRIFERYPVDHKHLTLMNEQDILLVREISAKGFSTQVSERGMDRLAIGDVYEARVRYLGEVYDLEAKVSWKANVQVGFEIVKADRKTLSFLRRLLKPIEIAASMREVNSSFMINNEEHKTWFHGDEDTDLYVWRDAENQIIAWQLVTQSSFVEWKKGDGLYSGSLALPNNKDFVIDNPFLGTIVAKDKDIDSQKKQVAIDILMALQLPVREELLATITEA